MQLGLVLPVSAKDLVRTIAAEHNGDMLAHRPAKQIGGKRTAVGERFINDRKEFLVVRCKIILTEDEGSVIGPNVLRHLFCMFAFIEIPIGEADAEGAQVGFVALHDRGNDAAVKPATKERSHRYIAQQPDTHRIVQQLLHMLHR